MFKSGIKAYRRIRAILMSSTLEAGEYLYNHAEKDLAADYFRGTINDSNEHHNTKCTAHLYMAALSHKDRDIEKTKQHLEAAREAEYTPTKQRAEHFDIMRKKFNDKGQKTGYIITDEEAETLKDQFNRMSFSSKGISGLKKNFSFSAKNIDEEIIAETSYELGRYYLNSYFEEKGDIPSKSTSITAITHAKKNLKQAFASKHLNPDERVHAGIMLAGITKETKPSYFDETYNILKQAREIPEASPQAKADATWILATLINSNRQQSGKEKFEFLPRYLNEVIENSADDTTIKEAKLLLSLNSFKNLDAPSSRVNGIKPHEPLANRIMKELADLGKEGSDRIKKDAYSVAGIIKAEYGEYFVADNLFQNALNIDTGLDYKEDISITTTLMYMNTHDGNVSNSIQYALQFIDKHHTAPKEILEQVQLIESLNPNLEGLTETINEISVNLTKQNNDLKKQSDKTAVISESAFPQIVEKFQSGFEALCNSGYCNDMQLVLMLAKKEKSAGK